MIKTGIIFYLLIGMIIGMGIGIYPVSAEETAKIRITYDNEWSGNIGSEDSSRTVNGEGDQSFMVEGLIVSAVIQKSDNSTDTLRVEIIYEGMILERDSSSSPYGIVSVTYAFDPTIPDTQGLSFGMCCLFGSFLLGALISASVASLIFYIRKSKTRRAIILDD